MLKLFNSKKTPLCLLSDCKDIEIESDLKTGLKNLSFSYPINGENIQLIQEEGYIQTEDYEFVIKEINKDDESFVSIFCKPNIENLLGKQHLKFESLNSKIVDCIRLSALDTGWTVQEIDKIGKVRTIRKEFGSTFDIISDCQKVYMVDLEFDTLNKVIKIYSKRGSKKGIYFLSDLNLKKVSQQSNTYEYITRLTPIGKDNLGIETVNEGKKYIDNNQYTTKIIEAYWIEKSYTDAQALKDDAVAKLKDLSKPMRRYSADVIDFDSRMELGDEITLIDNSKEIRETQRVIKIKEYPGYPERTTIEIANKILSFEEQQKVLKDAASIVGDITTDSGTIDKDKIEGLNNGENIPDGSITADKLAVNSVTAGKIKAGSINATHIEAGTIKANSAIIEDAAITKAKIGNAQIEFAHIKKGVLDEMIVDQGKINSAQIQDAAIGTAQIKDAQITVGKIQNAFIDDLVAKQGKFQSAHIGELTSNNIAAKAITAEKISANSISTDKIQAEAIKTENIFAGAITSEKINTNAIIAEKINAKAITADKIDTNAVTTDKLNAGSVTADKIAVNSVVADKIAANAITTNKINANAVTTEKINANSVTTDKIAANAITAEKIKAGEIDATKIKAETINSIEIGASKITSDKIASGEIKVGNANIVDGTILGAKITEASIKNAHIQEASIESSKIKNLKANKITSGTLDCREIDVTNLRAESITTGSITIDANNLVQNSMINDETKFWSLGEGWSKDSVVKLNDVNSFKYTGEGQIEDKPHYLVANHNPFGANSGAKCIQGEAFTASAYVNVEEVPFDGTTPFLGIWFYKSNEDGTLSTVANFKEYINLNKINQWQRVIVSGVAPKDAKYVKLVVCVYRNGNLNLSQPMLSKGTIATIWKPHTDELISDGAISNDKLGNEVVTANKLKLEEIFSEQGFIDAFQATTIKASKIEADILRNDLIRLEGLVGYEALNDEVASNFIFDTNDNKTYINGGQIYTNSIKAEKIDARGLTVTDNTNEPTFTIDSSGEVKVTGNIESRNWDEKNETGYQITKDGNATFNKATIRGNVILPNAGIDNAGDSHSSIRFWAGTDYAGKEDAPFRVMHDGSIFANKGEFNGTFTGSLSVGNIHIEDTNTTDGAIQIKTNDNIETKLSLSSQESFINTPLVLGNNSDKRLEFLPEDKIIEINNSDFKVNGAVSYVTISKGTTGLGIGNVKTDAYHTIQHTTAEGYEDSLLMYARGNAASSVGGDFRFAAKDRQVRVRVQGDLEVDNTIKSRNNNIEMRSKSDGFYFYAK